MQRTTGTSSGSKHVSNSFWRAVDSGFSNSRYYFSQIGKQAKRDGIKAIPAILRAVIPSATKGVIKAGVRNVW